MALDAFLRPSADAGRHRSLRRRGGRPIRGNLGATVGHYRVLGVHYFQRYNVPNLAAENEGAPPDPERYATRWSAAARPVILAGGLTGPAALSPGGDVDDVAFLDAALAALARRGQLHLLDCAWLALHNYAFRLHDGVIRRHLGRPLPMIATEGGAHVGVAFDPAYPPVDEARQLELVLDGYRYLRRAEREPYYFAASYWVIANAEGGPEPAWEAQALFRAGSVSPIVAALKASP
jgi:hypothetical protein